MNNTILSLTTLSQVSFAGGAPWISHRNRIVFPDVKWTGPACSRVSGVNVGPTWGKLAKESPVILIAEVSVYAVLSSITKQGNNIIWYNMTLYDKLILYLFNTYYIISIVHHSNIFVWGELNNWLCERVGGFLLATELVQFTWHAVSFIQFFALFVIFFICWGVCLHVCHITLRNLFRVVPPHGILRLLLSESASVILS